jgi:hypothetical protein
MNKNRKIDLLEIYAWLLIGIGIAVLIGGTIEVY